MRELKLKVKGSTWKLKDVNKDKQTTQQNKRLSWSREIALP